MKSEAAKRNRPRFKPDEVMLAVEIVSPSSVSMDRILKPALYARAGIPCFWRVELDPRPAVFVYELDRAAAVYQAAGEFEDLVETELPWTIRMPLNEILP